MAKKTYRKCPRCHRKGVHTSNGYPHWGDGTECCRYCGFISPPGKSDEEALAGQGGPRPRKEAR